MRNRTDDSKSATQKLSDATRTHADNAQGDKSFVDQATEAIGNAAASVQKAAGDAYQAASDAVSGEQKK